MLVFAAVKSNTSYRSSRSSRGANVDADVAAGDHRLQEDHPASRPSSRLWDLLQRQRGIRRRSPVRAVPSAQGWTIDPLPLPTPPRSCRFRRRLQIELLIKGIFKNEDARSSDQKIGVFKKFCWLCERRQKSDDSAKNKKMFRSGGKFSQFKMIKEEKIIAIVVSFNFFLFCIWNKVRF